MTFDAWGERGYTTTAVMPDEYTKIRAADHGGEIVVIVGSVTIHVTPDVLDRLHEAVTVAYELTVEKAVSA